MIRNTFRPQVEDVILHVTKRCPLRCEHCFVEKVDKDNNEITLEEIRTLSRDLGKITWLGIGGGEPFLRKDIVEIATSFKAQEVSIVTSATVKDHTLESAKKIVDKLGDKFIIFLSLDGLEQTHNSIRGGDNYNKVLNLAKELMQIDGLRVGIITTISSQNIKELRKLSELVKSLGVDQHAINLYRPNPFSSHQLPSNEELKSCLYEFYKSSNRSKWHGLFGSFLTWFNNYYSIKQFQIQLASRAKKKQIIPCNAGKNHIVVYPNGEVAPCESLSHVGNIRNDNIRTILSSKEMSKSVEDIRAKKCHCTHECNLTDSVLLNVFSFFKAMVFKD